MLTVIALKVFEEAKPDDTDFKNVIEEYKLLAREIQNSVIENGFCKKGLCNPTKLLPLAPRKPKKPSDEDEKALDAWMEKCKADELEWVRNVNVTDRS